MQPPFASIKLLVWLWLLTYSAFGQAPLKFKHLTVRNGLSDNRIWSVLQDRKGYFWFATLDGLNKYDGYSFTTYKYRPHDSTSIAHNVIFKIFEDSEGLLWIGTVESGLCKFDPATEQFTRYSPPQPKNSFVLPFRAVAAINEDQQGMLWVANYGGDLYRFNKKTGQFSEKYAVDAQKLDKNEKDWINTIYRDRAGVLWIGSKTGAHQLILAPGKGSTRIHFQHYRPDPQNANSLSGANVQAIFQDKKGLLWIGTGNDGLNRLNPKTGVFTRYIHDPENPHSISSNSLFGNSISEDARGNLWIGTFNGLNRLSRDQTGFIRYLHDPVDQTSIIDNVVSNTVIDRAGSLWAGTLKGISRADAYQPPFRSYQDNSQSTNSLRGTFVSGLYEDRTGTIWVATEQGLNAFDPRTNQFVLHAIKAGTQSYSRSICFLEDQTGVLWLSKDDQLLQFDRETGQFSPSGNPKLDALLAKQPILTLYEDRQGLLWIGSQLGARSFDRKTGTIRQYLHDPTNLQSVADYQINAIQEDRQGNLWFGHGSNALTKLDRKTGRYTRYQHKVNDSTSLSSNTIICIYPDKSGVLWFGTSGGGLCRFNEANQTFTSFTEKDGLANNTINAIEEDNQGNLWLTTNNGLSRFSPHTRTFTTYDEQDGLSSNQLSKAIWKARNGTIYVGSDNGFTAFRPEAIQANRYVPPIVITRFRLFDKALPGKQESTEIELSHRQNFISFEYAALDYTNAQKNQYRYRLEGVDPDWVEAGTRRIASYSDLSPGDYVFQVKGSNNNGVWNEQGTSIRIIIRPPWWRTWWAYTIYGLLFMAGIWAFTQYRSLALRRENRLLEEKVALRTEQLEHKSTELEQSLNDLKSTQAQLIQKEKMASLGELTAGIAHEIQNPLNFVNNFSEVSAELLEEQKEALVKGDWEEANFIADDLRQNLEKITHHGQRASSIVKGMLEHSRTNSGQKEPTDLAALAEEYLRLAYQGLRVKDKAFTCELITDFTPDLPLIEIAPQEIGRVLLNLYNNAFYAVYQKQKTLLPGYQPSVRVRTNYLNRQVEVRVEDNGLGIPESVKAKIFQPFFTTKPTGEGTGLGLSLSYDIVTKGYGGSLTVESAEGQGTEFIIHLPAE